DEVVKLQMDLKIVSLLVHIQQMFNFLSVQLPEKMCRQVPEIQFARRENASDRIENIKIYIENHIEERMTLDEIASEFFLTRCYLSHYFKRETGFSISEYIRTQKILKAKQMLKQDYSVTQISHALSFSSDSHFIETFKQMTGITPKKYIMEKRIQQQNGGERK
ncbi:MAG: AraC family transcriptional regulator, partial [Ruthenibacterium sp.]